MFIEQTIKYKIVISLLVISTVILLSATAWANIFPSESMARQNWKEVCEKVGNNEVASSEIASNGEGINIDCLSENDFVRYLPSESDPPTGAVVIKVKFKDFSKVEFWNWGNADFAVYYKGRAYILKNKELFDRCVALY
jgi:hypothetical protein